MGRGRDGTWGRGGMGRRVAGVEVGGRGDVDVAAGVGAELVVLGLGGRNAVALVLGEEAVEVVVASSASVVHFESFGGESS